MDRRICVDLGPASPFEGSWMTPGSHCLRVEPQCQLPTFHQSPVVLRPVANLISEGVVAFAPPLAYQGGERWGWSQISATTPQDGQKGNPGLREQAALSPPSGNDPVEIAKDFLRAHGAISPFTESEIDNLRLAGAALWSQRLERCYELAHVYPARPGFGLFAILSRERGNLVSILVVPVQQ